METILYDKLYNVHNRKLTKHFIYLLSYLVVKYLNEYFGYKSIKRAGPQLIYLSYWYF